ncbi:tyrosine-type recombinase/integrase [Bradyrhizobium sp. UFLA01-814]|uniref:tyrosine-type recombinase/integrase n=1 Tax=Bradyrhizobium sp. UFLA01-814 TaxID=3023480 RepID=UPI00398B2B2F
MRCVGKARKERCTPLTAHARGALQVWLKEPARHGANALFPNMHGGRLSADSVQSLLAKHVRVAGERCPSLAPKRVSPHVLRHSAAMELLHAGVDCSIIALWLGHESIETTQTYLDAISHSRKQLSQSSIRTITASESASSQVIACSPSLRRCKTPDSAEWDRGHDCSISCKCAQMTGSSQNHSA